MSVCQSGRWAVFQPLSDLLASVAETPGAIGYAELRCGEKSALSTALIRNADGQLGKPSAKSISDVALEMESKISERLSGFADRTHQAGESYPIASFTWFYVPVHPQESERSLAVKDYLNWVYGSGQEIAREQGYITLPPLVLQKVRAKVAALAK